MHCGASLVKTITPDKNFVYRWFLLLESIGNYPYFLKKCFFPAKKNIINCNRNLDCG